MKYIDAERLKAEIERRKKQDVTFRERNILIDIEMAIDSLQQEQPDKESLNESQHEFVNIVTERMLKEGPIPTLKGKQKAEFEKEFNRFKQITGMINFPAHMEVYKRIILWFMAWGADNLPNLGKPIDPGRMDIQQEQPEQPNDVRAEIEKYYGEDLAFEDERTKAAYHFFSAGKAFELREYEEEREKHITDLLDNFQKGMNAGYEKAISELKEGKVECSPVMKELIDKLFGIGNTFNFGFGPKNIQQEQLPGIEEHGIPGKDFIPVEWVDACEKYGKWKIVQQEQPDNWNDEYQEDELLTRFAFYTYKDEESVLYLSNLFVEKTSRNKGIGTKILQAAEKVAETIGAISICLKVKQNSPANAWYRKRGYGYCTFEGEYDWLEKKLEYLKPKQGQPEVDLEKEIEDWCDENITGVRPIYTADSLIYGLLPKTARHFYELGLNARKEEGK